LFDILKSRNVPYSLLKATVDIRTQNKILITFYPKLTRWVEINKAVHQSFPLLPTLFNIYLNEIIAKCQKEDLK